MPWRFEVNSGPSPRKIEIKRGETIIFGSSPDANVVFADDRKMSDLHFAACVSGQSLKIQNLAKTGGTQVNGKLTDAVGLKTGDRITAGETTFTVEAPEPSPYPAKVRLSGWGLEAVPEGWQPMEEIGFQLVAENQFRATISAVEELLPKDKTLAEYVDTQVALIRSQLPEAGIDGPVGAKIRGSDEAFALTVRSPGAEAHQVIQRQIYVAASGLAGIFTITVLDQQEAPLRGTLSSVVRGLSYFPG